MNEINGLLDDLCESDTLTEWEERFIADMAAKACSSMGMSEGEKEKIREIYDDDLTRL